MDKANQDVAREIARSISEWVEIYWHPPHSNHFGIRDPPIDQDTVK